MQAISDGNLAAILRDAARLSPAEGWFGATANQLICAKLAKTAVSLAEVSELSAAFLSERRAAVKNILGDHAFMSDNTEFAFLPVAESFAYAYVQDNAAAILLSLGLVEALRFSCLSGQLASAARRLQSDPALNAAISPAARDTLSAELRLMTAYFNACTVLYFHSPFPLPNVTAALDPHILHQTDVTLQAVLMFVILHEMGHVHFYRNQRPLPSPGLVWEFAVPEMLDARKEEELYADRFALSSVPAAFRLPLVHAATFFLHLHNYVDVAKNAPPARHPLPVNRIAALYAQARQYADTDATGQLAVKNALDNGTDCWQSAATPKMGLAALRRFVGGLNSYDWQPSVEALLLLAYPNL
jgi:hypothetical protein